MTVIPAAGRHYYPEDFGATGVGDDTAALARASSRMKAGDTLVIRSGKVYRHSLVWEITTPGIRIIGDGEIRATAEAQSGVWLRANDLYVEDVQFTCPTTTTRGSTPNNTKLMLYGGNNITCVRPRIVGASSVGIFVYGASNFLLDHPDVNTTQADGIHCTNGSNNGKIYSPRVQNSTDDGMAVVSYSGDAAVCSKIDVYEPKVSNVILARMFSIVGGTDIHYHNVDGDGSWAAGMYIACESGFSTRGILRCSMSGRIKNAQSISSPTRPDHGAVVIAVDRSGFAIDTVVVRGEFWDTWTGASRSIGILPSAGGTVSNIHLGPIYFRGTKPATDIGTSGGATYKSVAVATEA